MEMNWLKIGKTFQPSTSLVVSNPKALESSAIESKNQEIIQIDEDSYNHNKKEQKKSKKSKDSKKEKKSKKRKHEHSAKEKKSKKKQKHQDLPLVIPTPLGAMETLNNKLKAFEEQSDSSFDSDSSSDDDDFHRQAASLMVANPENEIAFLPNGQLTIIDRGLLNQPADFSLTWSIDKRKDSELVLYLGPTPTTSSIKAGEPILVDSMREEEQKKSIEKKRREKEQYQRSTEDNKTNRIFFYRNYFGDSSIEKPEKMKREERYFPINNNSSIKRFQYLLNPSKLHLQRSKQDENDINRSNFLRSDFLPLPVMTHDELDEKLTNNSAPNQDARSSSSASVISLSSEAKECHALVSDFLNYYSPKLSYNAENLNQLSLLPLFEYLHLIPFILYLQERSNGSDITIAHSTLASSLLFFLNDARLNRLFLNERFLSGRRREKRMGLLQERNLLEKRIYHLQQALGQLKASITSFESSSDALLSQRQKLEAFSLVVVESLIKFLYQLHHNYSLPMTSEEALEELITSSYNSSQISHSLNLHYHSYYYLLTSFQHTSHFHYSNYIIQKIIQYEEKVKNFVLLQTFLRSNELLQAPPTSAANFPVKDEKFQIECRCREAMIDQLYFLLLLEWNHYQHMEKIVALFQAMIMSFFPIKSKGNVGSDESSTNLGEYWESEEIRVGEVNNDQFFPALLSSTSSSLESLSLFDGISSNLGSYGHSKITKLFPLSHIIPIMEFPSGFNEERMDHKELEFEKESNSEKIDTKERIDLNKEDKTPHHENTKDDSTGPRYVYSRIHGYKIWIVPEDSSKVYQKILSEIQPEEPLEGEEDQENKVKEASEVHDKGGLFTKSMNISQTKKKNFLISYNENDAYLKRYYTNYLHSLLQFLPLRSSFPSHLFPPQVHVQQLYYEMIEDQPERVIFYADIEPSLKILQIPSSLSAPSFLKNRLMVRALVRMMSVIGLQFPWINNGFISRQSGKLQAPANFFNNYDTDTIFQRLLSFAKISSTATPQQRRESLLCDVFQHFHRQLGTKVVTEVSSLRQNYFFDRLSNESPSAGGNVMLVWVQRMIEYIILYYHHNIAILQNDDLLMSSEVISQFRCLLIQLYFQQHHYDKAAILNLEITNTRERCQNIIQLTVTTPNSSSPMSVVGDLGNWSTFLAEIYRSTGENGGSDVVKMMDRVCRAISNQTKDLYLQYHLLPPAQSSSSLPKQLLPDALIDSLKFNGIFRFYATCVDLLMQMSHKSPSEVRDIRYKRIHVLLTQFASSGVCEVSSLSRSKTLESQLTSDLFYSFGVYEDVLKEFAPSSKKKKNTKESCSWEEEIKEKHQQLLSNDLSWKAVTFYHGYIMNYFHLQSKQFLQERLTLATRMVNLDTLTSVTLLDMTPEIYDVITLLVYQVTFSELYSKKFDNAETRTLTQESLIKSIQTGEKIYETIIDLIYNLLTSPSAEIGSPPDVESNTEWESHSYLKRMQQFQYNSLFLPLSKVLKLDPTSNNTKLPRSITAIQAMRERCFDSDVASELLILMERLTCAHIDYLLTFLRSLSSLPSTTSSTSYHTTSIMQEMEQKVLKKIVVGLHHFPNQRHLLELFVSFQHYTSLPMLADDITSTNQLGLYYREQYFQHYLPLHRHYWEYEITVTESIYQLYSHILSVTTSLTSTDINYENNVVTWIWCDWKRYFSLLRCDEWSEDDYRRVYNFLHTVTVSGQASASHNNALLWRFLIYFILFRHLPSLLKHDEGRVRKEITAEQYKALREVKGLLHRAIYLHPYCKELYTDVIGVIKPLFEEEKEERNDANRMNIENEKNLCKEIDALLHLMEEQGIFLR